MKKNSTEVKIVVFSDTHLGFDYPIRPRIERRRRGFDFFKKYEEVLKYSIKIKADLVIHCGDFFFRSKIPQPVIDKSYEILFNFAANGIPILIIPGNHERSILPQSILTQHPGIKIFDTPENFNISIKDKTFQIYGFPFVRESSSITLDKYFSSKLSEFFDDQVNVVKILAIHQAIEGSSVGPVNFTFRRGKDVLSKSAIPDWIDLVLCGHIHRNQVLHKQSNDKMIPILFPGSIERTSFAEKDETKGFYILEFGSDKSFKFTFKELSSRPMIEIVINPLFSDERSLIIWLKKSISQLPDDAIIRIDPRCDENYRYLTAELLRNIIPKSMNWEVRTPRKKR